FRDRLAGGLLGRPLSATAGREGPVQSRGPLLRPSWRRQRGLESRRLHPPHLGQNQQGARIYCCFRTNSGNWRRQAVRQKRATGDAITTLALPFPLRERRRVFASAVDKKLGDWAEPAIL